ncbi:zinc finger protein 160-like isoform X3 [Gadus chalcogrammus]|uniref:zinc finger protein 160-like isoform X3 n=1 Tax=Gadus chalcogrammus TaxID=1042646 RepID=UPI0024C3FA1C|nr:zinc finger protein 160-like isoform X3 [Gadus chalcogrammus]
MSPARKNTWKRIFVGTKLSLKSLQPHFKSEDCDAFRDRSTQRNAPSEILGEDAPGSSHMSIHSEELKILSVYGKGEGPLATDSHDTLFTVSEVEALNSLSADHSVAKSLERGERLVCRKELSVQQQTPDTISIKVEEDIGGGLPAVEDCDAFGDRSTQRNDTSENLGVVAPGSSHMSSHSEELLQTPDTISIKVEEDIGRGMPAVEDGNDIRDCSTQRGATSESLRVDAPGSSHMSSHSGELRILSVYGQGEGQLAVDGHDTLFAASELEALSSLSSDHSVAKSLNCSVRLVRLEELTGHQGCRKGRPGVLCGKVIPNNANMIVHMRTHSGEKPYKCDQCTKGFSLKRHLKSHMRTHSGEKPYKCDQCTKRCRSTSHLNCHIMTHSGERPFRCDQCTKRFQRKCDLKIHLRTHSGEKPYKCDQCTKWFSQKSHLTGHLRTHSGEKPYRCDQCTKCFSLKDLLKRHMRTHSGEKPFFSPSAEDCDAFGDRSTQRNDTSENLGVVAPGSSHMSSHSEELLQQTPDTISIKVEEDIGRGMPAVEDGNDIRDCSTQRGATSESLRVDAPGSSHMSSHSGELRILSVYGQGEGPLAVDGHDTLFAASELEALSSLSSDHSVAKSLNCSVRLVRLEELTGHQGCRKGRPGVLCGKVIPNNANMIVHMRTHSGEKPYKCDQCTKGFSLKSHLKSHMRTHSGEKPYKCDQCTKRCRSTSHLNCHIMTHPGERPYRCDQCTKRFQRKCDLKIHLRTHSGEKPYKCDQCTKWFSQKSHLTGHLRTHSGEKPYRCDQCTKCFSLKDLLKRHMRIHSGEKPYKCEQCTKGFILKDLLKHHMRTHSGENPYKCDQCKKCFRLKCRLKRHMMTHSGEKPYKCEQCTKGFILKDHLKRHMVTHSGEKPYKCDQCTKCFSLKSNLNIHMRTHSGEKPYKCDQCTMRFSQQGTLKNHMRTHSG